MNERLDSVVEARLEEILFVTRGCGFIWCKFFPEIDFIGMFLVCSLYQCTGRRTRL
jgi:hypothetical protein